MLDLVRVLFIPSVAAVQFVRICEGSIFIFSSFVESRVRSFLKLCICGEKIVFWFFLSINPTSDRGGIFSLPPKIVY